MTSKLTAQGAAAGQPGSNPVAQQLIVEDIPVELRRNRRRRSRIGLVVDPTGVVVLDAPVNVTDAEVIAVVRDHSRWLRHKLNTLNAKTGGRQPSSRQSFSSGDLVYWLGMPLTLVVEPGLIDSVVLDVDARRGQPTRLSVLARDPSPASVAEQLRDWYRREAGRELATVLEGYRELPWLNGRVPPWGHRYMRSQWGSCSARGRLSLNTHLVKTPRAQIEYVVLHELCHLQHHHHGPAFHRLVEAHMPDWRERSAGLDPFLPLLMQHD
ncbi:MAG: SprT family zinc-dependent metalloprotease [Pseudomonadota bacterium]